MCGRPGAGPARSELKSRVWRPRIGSISRRKRLCSRKLAARRRIGLSNRFRASNQAARSGWRCRSARVAFSASFGRVPIPKDISRLWFKIRFGREPPTRSEQRKKRSRQASDRLGCQKPTMARVRQRRQIYLMVPRSRHASGVHSSSCISRYPPLRSSSRSMRRSFASAIARIRFFR